MLWNDSANASHSVPVYALVFAGTHCAYPDWVDLSGLLHTDMVYPSANGHLSKY